MLRATQFAHQLIQQAVKPGDNVADATVGNGHDTKFLAELVGPSGQVWGFDVQQAALDEAKSRVGDLPQVTLIQGGHETLTDTLSSASENKIGKTTRQLSAVMFNLGYLPGSGDGSSNQCKPQSAIMTQTATTLAGLEQALSLLQKRGLITLVLYPGHTGGDEEAAAVRTYASALPASYAVSHYARINSKSPAPELIAIERLS